MDNQQRKQWLGGFKGISQKLSRKSPGAVEPNNLPVYPQPKPKLPKPKQRKPSIDSKAVEEEQQKALEKRESLKDDAITHLPDGFFEEGFDPGLFELQQLEPGFEVNVLDEMAEGRANVLEFVNERLSKHVLANYDTFLRGINEAASVETDLEAALSAVRTTRGVLATTHSEVKSHLHIANRQKQRLALAKMADTLLNLQQASHLQEELKAAEEEADFTMCFWLCAQCCDSLEELGPLTAAQELQKTVNRLYQDCERRMHGALANVCTDFDEARYSKIVEAYTFLGNTAALGEEVNSSFVNVINTSTMKVVRGVVLTRAGLVDRAQSTTILQEILKWLPPDLYRQCLSKVLMVIFDILASHYRMSSWHESSIQTHLSKLSQLRDQMEVLQSADTSKESPQSPKDTPTPLEARQPPQKQNLAETQDLESGTAVDHQHKSETFGGSIPGGGTSSSPIEGAAKVPSKSTDEGSKAKPATPNQGTGLHEVEETDTQSTARQKDQQEEGGPDLANGHLATTDTSLEAEDSRLVNSASRATSRALSGVDEPGNASGSGTKLPDFIDHALRLRPSKDEAERDTMQEPEALVKARQEHETEAVWGETLMSVSEALGSGRRWVWDEAGRKVSLLLASPAAFQGEHFLQVLEWIQTIVNIGEAFSGSKSSHLREAMHRHSGKFFQAYHAGNLQALQQMLDQEMWTPLPALPGRTPDFKAELEGSGKDQDTSLAFATFPEWLQHQNPWKRQINESRRNSAEDLKDHDDAPGLDGIESGNIDSQGGQEDTDTESGRESSAVIGNGVASPSGRDEPRRLLMTNASWKMMQWMGEYAGLMRLLPSDATQIYCGCCELFELYFLHTFSCFSEVPLAEILKQESSRQVEVLPERLRSAVVRILNRSLPRSQERYLSQQNTAPQGVLGASGHLAASMQRSKPEPPGALLPSANSSSHLKLQERKVAVDSLDAAAKQLRSALPLLAKFVGGSSQVPEHHVLDNFKQTLNAALDLKDVILTAGARLSLPIHWLPERLSEQNFNLEEPPTKASPWVGVLYQHAKKFWQHLVSIESMSDDDRHQLWQYGLQYMAELVLEGFARAGVKSKCTMMGRSAMSVDIQGLQRGLQTITPLKDVANSITNSMRIVDAYIKAFYLPWGDELHKWAMTHPEYTQGQIMMLVNCIAEFQGIKRRERNQLLAQMDADLRELR